MCKFLIILGILLVLITLKRSYNNAVEFKLINFEYEEYNKSWFVMNYTGFETNNKKTTVFNMHGTILHPAKNIELKVYSFKKASDYKPWLYNTTLDVCRFLKRPYNPIAIVISKLLREFTNFNSTCPLVGPQIIKGFYLRADVLRLPMPTGDYLLTMIWLFNKRPQFATKAYYRFDES